MYKKFKVKEYWNISPKDKAISCYFLNNNNEYEAREFLITDSVTSKLFEGLTINLEKVCKENEKLLLQEEKEPYALKESVNKKDI